MAVSARPVEVAVFRTRVALLVVLALSLGAEVETPPPVVYDELEHLRSGGLDQLPAIAFNPCEGAWVDETKIGHIPGTETPYDPSDPSRGQGSLCNCHSWLFHACRGDPSDPDNDAINGRWDAFVSDDLAEFGFVRLTPGERPRLRDVVVYGHDSNENGVLDRYEVTHSAAVWFASGDDDVVCVVGKWGRNAVHYHPPRAEQALANYGRTLEYWRRLRTESE